MRVISYLLISLGLAQLGEGFFFQPVVPANCYFVGFGIFRRQICTDDNNNNNNNNNVAENPYSDYCVCTGSGDPHYKTFDGATIHFMGICKYTLAQLLDKNNKCFFNVEVKNEHRGWNRNVAYTRLVDVKLSGFTIRLHQRRRVFINNIEKYLPVTLDNGAKVERSGNNVLVTTNCGVQITFDGNSVVTVKVPKNIGESKMNGICGSCNGNLNDDYMTATGTNVANNNNMYNLIGNSYNVPDDSDQPHTHCMQIPPFPVCSSEHMSLFENQANFCGLMKDTSNVFGLCIDSGRVQWEGYLKSCKMDLCANYQSEDETTTICQSVGSMAADCADNGIPVNWRKNDFCPMVCGANEEYKFDASGCEETCVSPAATDCKLPQQEACVCQAGFVRSGNDCVQKAQCGCLDTNGDYYPMGSEKRTANCGELFQCVFEGGRNFLKQIQYGSTCHSDATCTVVDGEHRCMCNAGMTGDGVQTCVEETKDCICGGSGDPHYTLYDGQKIDFMGICMYTLSQLTDRQHPCWFSVEVKNEQRGFNPFVSWTRMVDFAIYGQKIRILSGNRVQVNGRTSYLPFTTKDNKIRVFHNGRRVQVDTDCGITVTFDGYSQIIITVPSTLGNLLNGICGNCNGRQDDYRTKEGVDVSRDRNVFNLIGLSYSVVDDSDAITRGCTPPVEPPTECTSEMTAQISDNVMCGMITDTAGPFRECINAAVVDVEQYFENCKVDICAYAGKPGFDMHNLVCQSLTSFAAICNDYGFELFWRNADICPLPCGANEEYSPSVDPCPVTCNGQLTGTACSRPRVEGCQCKAGYVLSDNKCVQQAECGCKDSMDNYIPLHSEFSSVDCGSVFKCELVGGAPDLVEYPAQGCHNDATCQLKDGDRKCVCKNGYAGDGVYSCINTKPCHCSVSGDPHYLTYDGQVIHFQGTCKYTLSQSTTVDDECAFNVEVKNENRYRNKDVSWTRMVDFEIYGIRVRLLPKNKVEINGEEKFLPFTLENGKLRVSYIGGKIHVDTDCGISVQFDGIQDVSVDVPNKYANNMTGICGDCNGIQDDYKSKEGDDLSSYDETSRGQEIGNSYIVEDDSGVSSDRCIIEKPPVGCDDDLLKQYSGMDYCGLMMDYTGPFKECMESGLVPFEQFFSYCQKDLCAYSIKGKFNPKDIVCESMTSFAAACNQAGFVVMWREENFCPMQCFGGKVYSTAVTACPATCGEPSPAEFCQKPPQEGCECPVGMYLNDKRCTKKERCGCTDEEGNYLPIGEKRVSDNCTKVYECIWDRKNVRSFIDETVNGPECGMDATCTAFVGGKNCTCNEGFVGDGFTCTLTTTPPPTTTPIPTTAPPCEMIADVAIIMDSSSSIGEANYQVMKDFVQDVVTNFDVKPDKVRVAVETYNKKPTIQFNFNTHGDEADIPFAIQKIDAISRGTYTDLALETARKKIFTTAREGVPKIAIVLTDGLSRMPQRTRKQAKLLQDSGVTVFCIGIGDVSPKEVAGIATDPDNEHAFLVEDFQALKSIKETIKAATCEASQVE